MCGSRGAASVYLHESWYLHFDYKFSDTEKVTGWGASALMGSTTSTGNPGSFTSLKDQEQQLTSWHFLRFRTLICSNFCNNRISCWQHETKYSPHSFCWCKSLYAGEWYWFWTHDVQRFTPLGGVDPSVGDGCTGVTNSTDAWWCHADYQVIVKTINLKENPSTETSLFKSFCVHGF